jgi:deoxyribodipyrimidine photo-lyase
MYNENLIPRPLEVLEDTIRNVSAGPSAGNRLPERAVVHWFKRDLRVHDNTALRMASEAAKKAGVGVIGLWILSAQDWEAHLVSPAKCDFELRSLAVLQRDLAALNIPLHFEVVDDRKRIPQKIIDLCVAWKASKVYCNIEYEVDELRRDTKLVKMCYKEGISFYPQHDDCIVPPGRLKTGGGKQFAVYSPFFRAWVKYLHENPEVLEERKTPYPNPADFRNGQFAHLFNEQIPEAPESKRLDPDTKARLAHLYPAGESAALDRLQHFLNEKIGEYQTLRNFPAKNCTARVSMHHAAGTLAARTSIRMARDVNSTKKLDAGNEGIRSWISEVAWRDFYRHVLANWPYIW